MFRILIAEPTHKSLQNKLEDAGFICDLNFELSNTELINLTGKYQGLIIRSKYQIDKGLIDAAKDLKFIARAGSGMENIDVSYAEKNDIICISSPEGNRDSVGEHTLGMLLSLLHKINSANNEVKKGEWNRKTNIGTELQGKTVGILGYGNMGSAFAQRLQGFDLNVIAYDKYKTQYSDNFVKEVDLETFFKETDILSIHVPLTEETKFMIKKDYINKFENNIYILNTARGKVLKTSDLVLNLKSKKVIGAALDVLEYEKTHFESIVLNQDSDDLSFLIHANNIILTPHVAGSSGASYRKIAEVLAEKVIKQFKK